MGGQTRTGGFLEISGRDELGVSERQRLISLLQSLSDTSNGREGQRFLTD
jgi:hypothetical protein